MQQTLPPVSGNFQLLQCIDFNNQNHGITGGFYADITIQQFNGSVYYTSDGGNNWLQSLIPDSMRTMQAVQIINDSLAYGAGAFNKSTINSPSGQNQRLQTPSTGGYFVESTDGGATWHSKGTFEDSIYILTGMSFLNQQTGYVIGAYPDSTSFSILKTTDGGNNWNYVYPLTNYLRLNDINFIDDQHGIVVGEQLTGQGVVLMTTDGGETWTNNYLNNIYTVLTCKFVDLNNILISGYTVSDAAFIYKSTDGGVSWSEFRTYISHGIEGVDEFQDSGIILVYGAYLPNFENIPFFDISFDGGNTWTYNQYPQYQYYIFYDSKMGSESRWYLTGTANSFPGTVLFTDNSGGLPVELISFNAQVDNANVILDWTTATETNNKGFDVERASQNYVIGVNFEWEKIGYVAGNGTSAQTHSYFFTDKNVNSGKYYYRLKQIDFNGKSEYSKEVEADINLPLTFSLEQNYPNPFNPTTTIKYSIPMDVSVRLDVYNILGQQVANLVNDYEKAGNYEVMFHGGNLSSGTYFYILKTGTYAETRKMMLIR